MSRVGVKDLLVTGRTVRQGRSMEMGKLNGRYVHDVAVCEVNPVTLEVLGIDEGNHIEVETVHGSIVVRCSVNNDVEPGIAFIPCGPYANAVTGSETGGTGMPHFKGIEAMLFPAPDREILGPRELLDSIIEERM